jgi:uncharacterized protein with HEPN domain
MSEVRNAYLGIDNDMLWSIIQDDIPILLLNLQALKETEDNLKEKSALAGRPHP